MRALVQRVRQARVEIAGRLQGEIGQGFLIYLGVGPEDSRLEADKLWQKIRKLRIFADQAGKTNLDLASVAGEVLVVSQFTLFASVKRGNRPSFTGSAPPALAEELYSYFIGLVQADLGKVATGIFGADMQVSSINDGPFTLWIDTEDFGR